VSLRIGYSPQALGDSCGEWCGSISFACGLVILLCGLLIDEWGLGVLASGFISFACGLVIAIGDLLIRLCGLMVSESGSVIIDRFLAFCKKYPTSPIP
jgi:hypothetical protein